MPMVRRKCGRGCCRNAIETPDGRGPGPWGRLGFTMIVGEAFFQPVTARLGPTRTPTYAHAASLRGWELP